MSDKCKGCGAGKGCPRFERCSCCAKCRNCGEAHGATFVPYAPSTNPPIWVIPEPVVVPIQPYWVHPPEPWCGTSWTGTAGLPTVECVARNAAGLS